VVSTLDAATVSSPQSPTAILPPVTGWPSTRRLAAVVPFALPPAPEGPVPADARAVTASAVISPLKSDTCVASASAFAEAFFVTALVAVAVVEAARTTDPSAGKTNDEVVTGAATGGDEDVPVAVTGWFGIAMRMAFALALAPGEPVPSPALVETNARSASRSGRARRRRTDLDDANEAC
jgi:hypothetical protein